MHEGLTEVQANGFDGAGNLFDELVTQRLRGGEVDVVIEWEEHADERGENYHTPHVTINGTPAQQYCKELMEWSTTDEELIDETSSRFVTVVAMLWDDTIEYYSKLDELAPVIDTLASSKSAGYRDQAVAEYVKEGVERPLTVDVIQRARTLVCKAFESWVDASNEQSQD